MKSIEIEGFVFDTTVHLEDLHWACAHGGKKKIADSALWILDVLRTKPQSWAGCRLPV
jgi:hypothetical protein